MKLDDLFENLELNLPFLFGPRHSRCPEIWNPQNSKALTVPHWPK